MRTRELELLRRWSVRPDPEDRGLSESWWTDPPRDGWVGCRVRVPFGKRSMVGLVLEVGRVAGDPAAVRAIEERLDDTPAVSHEWLATLRWAAAYYVHPIGEAIATALPGMLRVQRAVRATKTKSKKPLAAQAGPPLDADQRDAVARVLAAQRRFELLDDHIVRRVRIE